MTRDQPSDINDAMDDETDGATEDCQPGAELRLGVGLMALAVLLYLADWVGWGIAGKPPTFSPVTWLKEALTQSAEMVLGVWLLLLLAAVIWGLGLVTMKLGDVVIHVSRRLFHRKKPPFA